MQTNYFYNDSLKDTFLDIGQAVKLCRSQRGWTLRELSKRTGIAVSHLSMIEHNQRDASMTAMQAMANALGMPLNVLIFLAADPKELTGISNELKEKLSRAALELLRLPTTDHLF
jgi:transcriptional regulator with XRE-family HTH domain